VRPIIASQKRREFHFTSSVKEELALRASRALIFLFTI
jgi:hypothetical protein